MRKKLFIGIIVLIAFFVVCIRQNQAMDIRKFDFTEFQMRESIEQCIENGNIIIDYDSNVEKNIYILEGPYLALAKGEYIIALSYNTNQENSYCEIYSATTMEVNGEVGKLLGREMLVPDKNRVTFSLSLEQDITNLEIRVFYGGGNLEINEIVMRNRYSSTDAIVLFALLLISVLVIYMFLRNASKESLVRCGVLILAISMCTLPYLNDFLINGHDLKFHLARIEGIYQGIMKGNFPVRINPIQANGYGNASITMYPSLFLYIPALLRMTGLSLMNSYKVFLVIINIFTVIIGYVSFKNLFNREEAGFVGSILWLLCPYRLTNMFVRAALGELLAMIFLPMILWGIYEIIVKDYKKWFIVFCGFTGVLQSHILSMEMYTLLVFIVCLLAVREFWKEKKRVIYLLLATVITILVNLWMLIPFLQYMREEFYIFGDYFTVYIPDRTVYLSQLFTTFVENEKGNIPLGTTKDEMSLSLGGILLGGMVLFYFVSYVYKEDIIKDLEMEQWQRIGKYSSFIAIILISMTLWIFPWEILIYFPIIEKFLKTLQFLWRLLSVVSMLLCMVSVGAMCIFIKKYRKYQNIIVVTSLVMIFLLSLYYIDSTTQFDTWENKAAVANINSTDYNYLYEGDDLEAIERRGNVVTFSNDSINVYNFYKDGTFVSFDIIDVYTTDNMYMELPLYYYPGYIAIYNGEELPVERGTNGVVRVVLEADKDYSGTVNVFFKEPNSWIVGNVISLISFGSVFVYFVRGKGKKFEKG